MTHRKAWIITEESKWKIDLKINLKLKTEILCITEKIGDKDIIYRFDLNTNDCVISMPLGTPEYIGTLDLIEKSVMENKKKLM